MTRSEKLIWGLGMIICLVIPLALGYYGLALAGGGELVVLAWRVKKGAQMNTFIK